MTPIRKGRPCLITFSPPPPYEPLVDFLSTAIISAADRSRSTHEEAVVTKRLAAASLAGVALTLSACGGGSVASPSPSNAAVEVNFATANNMLHVPEFVALEKGFYLKHGIKAKFQVFNL